MLKEEKELKECLYFYVRGAGKSTIHKFICAFEKAVREDERSKHICPCDICRGEAAIRRKK